MVLNENKKAVIWSGIEKVGTYVVNFGIQIVLARLLCPEDYAIVAMLAIFFSISQAFIDSGFATTLIQKQDCTQTDYSSVFFFNILVGTVVYLLFFFGAPWIEKFYNYPNLAIVTRVYSLNLLIHSFSMVHRVILTKELRFKNIAVVTFATSIISAIPAIIMAYFGFGYWALVTQSLISAVVTSALIMYQSHWKPSLVISKDSLLKLAPFGLRMLAVYLFHAVYNNIYSLLIGKKFPAQDLGYYDRGKSLSSMGPVGLSDFYMRALYPIQAKIQNNKQEIEKSYNKSFSILCLAVVPISAFMFFFSKETIYTLYGEQWINSSFIFHILCVGFMFYPLQALNVNMLKVKGRGDYMLRSETIKKTMGILCVAIMINFNIKLVVIGWTCYSIAEFIISVIFYHKLYKFSLIPSAKMLLRTVSIAYVLSYLMSFVFGNITESFVIRFFAGGISFIFLYVVFNLKTIMSLLGINVKNHMVNN